MLGSGYVSSAVISVAGTWIGKLNEILGVNTSSSSFQTGSRIGGAAVIAGSFFVGGGEGEGIEEETNYLYQKLDSEGQHLKFGITNNPASRYSAKELAGGRLNIIAQGVRSEMLRLERSLHEVLPIGPEERQQFYIRKQVDKGLLPPPYN